jgi:tRNA threonylcarbamoyladenosine biosynthesis protein TsaE
MQGRIVAPPAHALEGGMMAATASFTISLTLESLSATQALAGRIAAGLRTGSAVALEGDLGAGKTALARGILQALGVTEAVPSPSFTLVQIYDTARFTVFHYDLYRIENVDELRELALEDALSDGVALIEWPERLEQWPEDTLRVRLAIMNEGVRRADISGPARWAEFLASERTDGQRS